jgi:hypothetical protein
MGFITEMTVFGQPVKFVTASLDGALCNDALHPACSIRV